MNIHLPIDLESSIQAAVQNGQFASVDEAMTAAVRLLLRELVQQPAVATNQAKDSGLVLSVPCATTPIYSTKPLSMP